MGAVKRVVSTEFWTDDKVIDSFTPEDKYFMLYLLTNPHTKQIGIYQLNIKQAAFETGYSRDSVSHLLERFEKVHGVIRRSTTTSEIAIKNYLCYSIVKGGKPVLDVLRKESKSVKDTALLAFVINSLKERDDLLETVVAFVEEMATKKDKDNENDNDNDNDNENDNDSTGDVRKAYVNYQSIIKYFNDNCVSLPKVIKITDSRKKAIKAMLKNFTEEDFQNACLKTEQSDFLSGRSGKWQGTFDWLIKTANMTKVLEGNYDNRKMEKGEKNDTTGKADEDKGYIQRFIEAGGRVEFDGF